LDENNNFMPNQFNQDEDEHIISNSISKLNDPNPESPHQNQHQNPDNTSNVNISGCKAEVSENTNQILLNKSDLTRSNMHK